MKINSYRPLSKDDIPQVPEWEEELRVPDIAQLKIITQALQNQLNTEDNFNAETITVNLVHDTWEEIGLKKIRGKPTKVYLNYVNIPKVTPIDWYPLRWIVKDIRSIWVKLKFSADPGMPIEVSFDVHGAS